jgi:FtsH-like protein
MNQNHKITRRAVIPGSAAVVAVALIALLFLRSGVEARPISFMTFMQEVDRGSVQSVRMQRGEITGRLVSGGEFRALIPDAYRHEEIRRFLKTGR